MTLPRGCIISYMHCKEWSYLFGYPGDETTPEGAVNLPPHTEIINDN